MLDINKISPIDAQKLDCDMLFNNLPEVIRATTAAQILDVSIKTIYDWRYRQETRNIPANLFLKINRTLYLNTSVLRKWITSQNP
ncbi:MAG: helix-turn-helix domain-containing protein [Oligoflexia bacterium]|nr:helix-turn-helix domain-containing protein [Oligoflexia bacterium]